MTARMQGWQSRCLILFLQPVDPNTELLTGLYLEDSASVCDPNFSGDESNPECGFSCGCGKCSLAIYLEKGCPSFLEDTEFPYLFPNKLNMSELRLLKWKLIKASRKIVQKFASLERNTISMLKETEVPLDEVKNYVLTLGVMYKSVYKDKPLLLQEKEKIETVKDFGSLFFILKAYYSWFSFSIIEALREDFLFHEGTEEDEKLNKYKMELYDYCKRRIFECPKSMFLKSRSEGLLPLIVKVDDDFNVYTLNHVAEFRSSMSEILRLSKHTLQLCDVTNGCVRVVLGIPNWLAHVITIRSDQQQHLVHIGVKQLRVANRILYEMGKSFKHWSPNRPPQHILKHLSCSSSSLHNLKQLSRSSSLLNSPKQYLRSSSPLHGPKQLSRSCSLRYSPKQLSQLTSPVGSTVIRRSHSYSLPSKQRLLSSSSSILDPQKPLCVGSGTEEFEEFIDWKYSCSQTVSILQLF